MRTDFKVYPRKIHVYYKSNIPKPRHFYKWSTNAYRTCRDAVAAAKALHPDMDFVARFAKD
jgi:hypothetical protein